MMQNLMTVSKNNISVEEEQMLRKELNVKAFVPKSSLIKPQAFPLLFSL